MKISILLVTYNHSRCIRQCMEGIKLQQFNQETEIVVADDHSSDNTLAIIQEYIDQIPCEFVFLDDGINKGTVKNYQQGFAACRGVYIAIIEGDDYWTNPRRLIKHVSFLENHQECVMSMNRFIEFDEVSNDYRIQKWSLLEEFEYVTTRQMTSGNRLGNLSACVFRNSEIQKIKPDLYNIEIADWMIGMVLGQNGLIAVLKDVMSVYRIHNNGQWSKMNKEELSEKMNIVIDKYNEYFEYKYDNEFTLYKGKLNGQEVTSKSSYSFRDFVPPIVIHILKLIIPPFIIKKLTS